MPLFWALSAFILGICMIIYPQEIYTSSLYGLRIWWDIVLPSLLPFFIIANVSMNLGAVKVLGALVEPLMRPLFNLPGESALVVAIGFTSGFPIGAALTAKLRKENTITRIEAERLLAFTNNASPLFMFVALAVGMLRLPDVGLIIAVSHYCANIGVGLIFRFHGKEKKPNKSLESYPSRVRIAFKHFLSNKTKPIGILLSDAVKSAMQSLTSIGGYIIFFAVLLKCLELLGFIAGLENLIAAFLPFELSSQFQTALAKGFFEMTIGNRLTAEALGSIETKLMLVSVILAWSGLSIHAQVISQINDTDIRYYPFLIARIIQVLFAVIICKILFSNHVFTIAQTTSFSYMLQNSMSTHQVWMNSLYLINATLVISLVLVATKKLHHFIFGF